MYLTFLDKLKAHPIKIAKNKQEIHGRFLDIDLTPDLT